MAFLSINREKDRDKVREKDSFSEENSVILLPAIQIRPNKTQPRRYFNEAELKDLSQSIKANGVLQPLTVRRVSQTEYELIAGERRLRACVMAGMSKVPCVVMKCSDRESAVFALLENLQRSDLNVFEEARGIARLIRKYGMTQEQCASKLGKGQSTVANKLRLLKLSYEEQDWITQAGLSERHARALLKVGDEALRREALSRIISEGFNVNQTEQFIERLLEQSSAVEYKQGRKIVIRDVRIFVNTINKAVDTMRLSGINAISKKTETEEYIEYTVKIPKENAFRRSKTA